MLRHRPTQLAAIALVVSCFCSVHPGFGQAGDRPPTDAEVARRLKAIADANERRRIQLMLLGPRRFEALSELGFRIRLAPGQGQGRAASSTKSGNKDKAAKNKTSNDKPPAPKQAKVFSFGKGQATQAEIARRVSQIPDEAMRRRIQADLASPDLARHLNALSELGFSAKMAPGQSQGGPAPSAKEDGKTGKGKPSGKKRPSNKDLSARFRRVLDDVQAQILALGTRESRIVSPPEMDIPGFVKLARDPAKLRAAADRIDQFTREHLAGKHDALTRTVVFKQNRIAAGIRAIADELEQDDLGTAAAAAPPEPGR